MQRKSELSLVLDFIDTALTSINSQTSSLSLGIYKFSAQTHERFKCLKVRREAGPHQSNSLYSF